MGNDKRAALALALFETARLEGHGRGEVRTKNAKRTTTFTSRKETKRRHLGPGLVDLA